MPKSRLQAFKIFLDLGHLLSHPYQHGTGAISEVHAATLNEPGFEIPMRFTGTWSPKMGKPILVCFLLPCEKLNF